MRHRTRIIGLVCVGLATAAPPLLPQRRPPASDSTTAIVPGARVRLTTSEWRRDGTLAAWTADSAVLMVPGAASAVRLAAPLSSIRQLELSRGRRNRFMTGAVVGTAVGALIGVALSTSCNPRGGDYTPAWLCYAGATVAGTMGGMVLGGATGAVTRSDVWIRVPLPVAPSVGAVADAQAEAGAPPAPAGALAPGVRVRVTTGPPRRVVSGIVSAVTAAEVIVLPDGRVEEQERLPRPQILTLEASTRRHRRVVPGLVLGLAAGTVVAIAVTDRSGGSGGTRVPLFGHLTLPAVASMLGGAAAGAGTGALLVHEHWSPLPRHP